MKRFQYLIDKEYGYIPNILTKSQTTPKITLGRIKIVNDLTSYSKFGCERWIIPKCIMDGSDEIKYRFIRGFFDGDVTQSNNGFVIYSANKDSLFNLYELLESLNILSTFRGPYKRKGRKNMYEIYVRACSRERFITLIDPIKYKPASHSFR
ncbi:MAG: LAGLIDADG family homing endonuclease [Candidatus Aenigmarchaeota archaeon]|nr:LAGLIDADG family homing endonuclease [Candidatus Aenigmarchaeota archaeon]